MKTNEEFTTWLKKHNACNSGIRVVAKQTPQEFYNSTNRPDWLLWWIGRAINENLPGYPTLKQYKKCVVEIARKVKHLIKDERINKVFDLLDESLKNDDSALALQALKIAIDIRNKAVDADAYAAATDAYASAAAYAAYAADAYAAATAATAATAAYAAARKKMRTSCADLVRELLIIKF